MAEEYALQFQNEERDLCQSTKDQFFVKSCLTLIWDSGLLCLDWRDICEEYGYVNRMCIVNRPDLETVEREKNECLSERDQLYFMCERHPVKQQWEMCYA